MQPATVLSQREIQRIARHLAAITVIVAGLNHAAVPAPKIRRRRRRSTAGATVTDRLRHAIQTSPPTAPPPARRRGRPPKAVVEAAETDPPE